MRFTWKRSLVWIILFMCMCGWIRITYINYRGNLDCSSNCSEVMKSEKSNDEFELTVDKLHNISEFVNTNVKTDQYDLVVNARIRQTNLEYSSCLNLTKNRSVTWYIVANNPEEYRCDVYITCADELSKNREVTGTLCPCIPPNLVGRRPVNITVMEKMTMSAIIRRLPSVTAGGGWRPSHCSPRRRVAVIIPFRDRQRHLRVFLAHMHPILQRQLLEYRIFVVEQNLPYLFNKASLMNVGFLEAWKMFPMDCVLFFDVDTLIESDENMVACGRYPIHYSAYTDRHKYRLRTNLFGSAVLLKAEDFRRVNGFSNLYFGWGAEDDDLKNRVQ